MNVLSVDLGTSNTVAVLSAHGRAPRVIEVDGSATMPSAIYADEDGGLVVGRDAERRARLDPSRFEPNPKRRVDEGTLLLGTTVIPVTDALAAVLRRVADETSRQLGGA
ncbi:Hsp70 family protein, partial [Actinokineospora sp. HBU206404]|nr:Hsp70 family protein [Actinokineospora xionganensis]